MILAMEESQLLSLQTFYIATAVVESLSNLRAPLPHWPNPKQLPGLPGIKQGLFLI